MAKICYIRVFIVDQKTDRQEIALSKLEIEKISGKNSNRPELKKMLEYIREGDILYIESISRLARSTRYFLSIVEQLQNKKVELISLKENIYTTTSQGLG